MEAELCLSLASLFNMLGCQMSPRSLGCRQMNQQCSAPVSLLAAPSVCCQLCGLSPSLLTRLFLRRDQQQISVKSGVCDADCFPENTHLTAALSRGCLTFW